MPPFLGSDRQRGIATLGITIAVLLLMTVSVFYVNRFLLVDLKTASNQYRSTQAFEAAESGLAQGAAWLQRRAAALETSNPGCAAGSAIPIRLAVWGCKDGSSPPSAECTADPFEWLLPAATCNAGIPATDTVTLQDNTFSVNVGFRRRKGALAALYTVEILSTAQTPNFATSLDPFRAQASAVETIVLRPLVDPNTPANPNAPLLVKGTVSNVTGTPDICPKAPTDTNINQGNRADCAAGTGQTGVAIATLAPNTAGIDVGSFNTHGGPISALNAPSATVHEVLFPGVTEAQVCEVSKWQAANVPVDQRNVFYYGSACPDSPYTLPNKLSPVGTTTAPVVIYVGSSAYAGNACPGLSPGEYYGVLYIGGDCNANGWGNVDYYGGIAIEGNLTKFTANTISRHQDLSRGLTGGGGSVTPGTVARAPGSWRDY